MAKVTHSLTWDMCLHLNKDPYTQVKTQVLTPDLLTFDLDVMTSQVVFNEIHTHAITN